MNTKYHLIGIGGAGMSAIAELLLAAGMTVSGSDRTRGLAVEKLEGLGASVFIGHDGDHVPAGATVVVSSAIKDDNPELVRARERGQEIIHRSVALARAAHGQDFIAVAGAHGKTTTSAMMAHMLMTCGADPSFAVGSPVLGVGTGARRGRGGAFVAEADESDESFLNYSPEIAVVTNIEPDHIDHYADAEAFYDVFRRFSHRINPGGVLLCCGDDLGSADLARSVRDERDDIRVFTYGTSEANDILVSSIHPGPNSVRARLRWGALDEELDLNVGGEHNALNATAAWAVGVLLRCEPHRAATALAQFRGTSRRFECVGEVRGRKLFDDYAHHPTEVAAMVRQARQAAGEGRVIVLFQPHLYSRTLSFADRFAQSLSGADEVFLTDVYGAREDPMEGVDSGLIASQLPGARYLSGMSVDEAAAVAAQSVEPGDIMVLVGAGDISAGAQSVLDTWGQV